MAAAVLSQDDKESLASKLDLEKLTSRVNIFALAATVNIAMSVYIIKLLVDILQKLN